MRYTGIDWATKGWFAVSLDDDGGWSAGFYPTILNFWHETDGRDRILIDVPVGLAKDRARACDDAAREYLGDAASSVFPTPVRGAVYAENVERAKAVHEERDVGFSVSSQAWSIVPQIREVDVFLKEYGHRLGDTELRESHPEACFAALNGGDPVPEGKDTDAGRQRRLDLLGEHLPDPAAILADVEARFAKPSYAPTLGTKALDDVVDAMGLAVTARHDDLVVLPEDPRTDFVLGRPIEIVRPPDATA